MGPTVDLVADLGEGFGAYSMGDDAALLEVVSSANIACGFHAGDPDIMNATVAECVRRGVRRWRGSRSPHVPEGTEAPSSPRTWRCLARRAENTGPCEADPSVWSARTGQPGFPSVSPGPTVGTGSSRASGRSAYCRCCSWSPDTGSGSHRDHARLRCCAAHPRRKPRWSRFPAGPASLPMSASAQSRGRAGRSGEIGRASCRERV